jgi:outer membrane murein-binding lipoprotein Lpp
MSTKLEPLVTDPNILREIGLHGGTVQDAMKKLAPHFEAEARKVDQIIPHIGQATKAAKEAAEAATETANRAAEEARRFFSDIEGKLFVLGKVAVKAEIARRLVITDIEEKEAAFHVINSFVAATNARSVQTITAFELGALDLMRRQAVRGHISVYLQQLEYQAEEMRRDIVAFCAENHADLQALIGIVLDEKKEDPDFSQFRGIGAFAGLVKTISQPVVAENAQV